MKQLTGKIYRPKNRLVWMLWLSWAPKKDGSYGPRRESAKTRDEAIARTRLARRLVELQLHREGEREFDLGGWENLTFNRLFDDLLEWYRYDAKRNRSLPSIEARLSTKRKVLGLRQFFGPLTLAQVTPARVKEYRRLRREMGAAPATCDRELEIFRRSLVRGVKAGLVPKFIVPKIADSEEIFYRPDNARHIDPTEQMVELVTSGLKEPYRDLARFAAASGWRRGEMLNLKWDWINREQGIARVPPEHAKNGKEKFTPLVGELAEIIERRWEARQIESQASPFPNEAVYVFHHKNGNPIRPSALKKAWERARKAVGLEDFNFHDLRHFLRGNLGRTLAPPEVGKALLGHRSLAMYDRYADPRVDDQREALERVEARRRADRAKLTVLSAKVS